MFQYADVPKLLIEKGADGNASKDTAGWSTLHFRCKENSIEVATLLIRGGAGINAINEENETPLDLVTMENVVAFKAELVAEAISRLNNLTTTVPASGAPLIASTPTNSTN